MTSLESENSELRTRANACIAENMRLSQQCNAEKQKYKDLHTQFSSKFLQVQALMAAQKMQNVSTNTDSDVTKIGPEATSSLVNNHTPQLRAMPQTSQEREPVSYLSNAPSERSTAIIFPKLPRTVSEPPMSNRHYSHRLSIETQDSTISEMSASTQAYPLSSPHTRDLQERATCNSTPEPVRKTPDNKYAQEASNQNFSVQQDPMSSVYSAFSQEIYSPHRSLHRAKTAQVLGTSNRRNSNASREMSRIQRRTSYVSSNQSNVQEKAENQNAPEMQTSQQILDPISSEAHKDENVRTKPKQGIKEEKSKENSNDFRISRSTVYTGIFASVALAMAAATFFTVRSYRTASRRNGRQSR